jgi:hypothetical protein
MKTKKEQLKFIALNVVVTILIAPLTLLVYSYITGYGSKNLSGICLSAVCIIFPALALNGAFIVNLWGKIKSNKMQLMAFLLIPCVALLWSLRFYFSTAVVFTLIWMLSNLVTWIIYSVRRKC